jgi:hypothetical protein
MEAQHTLEWYRKRLGKITGSRVGDLMKSSRKKDEIFGDTAKSYIYQLASERDMNPNIVEDDELFELYLQQVGFSSKAIEWGNQQEENARQLYIKNTGRNMAETGLCVHPTIPNFGSSPDGYYYDSGDKGTLEVKCPNQNTFMKYKVEISDNASLLLTKPEYFFQCQSHMMVTGASWCDFVVYCPFQRNPIHITRIFPDGSCFDMIEKRIRIANDIIDELIDAE